jgi:hypothetical protein
MRIGAAISCPRDIGCNARLPNLAGFQDKARDIGRCLRPAGLVGLVVSCLW